MTTARMIGNLLSGIRQGIITTALPFYWNSLALRSIAMIIKKDNFSYPAEGSMITGDYCVCLRCTLM